MCKGTAGAASHAAALCPPIKEKNMFQAFLIKYGEIGVKGKNRYVFEDALVDGGSSESIWDCGYLPGSHC